MHGWADGRLGELGEGTPGLAGTAFFADPSTGPERDGQENKVTVVAGQGLAPAGSWVTAFPLQPPQTPLLSLRGFSKAAQPAASPANIPP